MARSFRWAREAFAQSRAADYRRASAWIPRGLGLVFALSFLSLLIQVRGLIGAQGIAPAQALLSEAGRVLGAGRWLQLPTVFWLGGSDGALIAGCWVGLAAGVALALGLLPRWMLLLCWALCLSFQTVGEPFLSFQWDILLLEAAVCALFLGGWGLRLEPAARGWGLWLIRLLLFKLMLLSGLVKLGSGDPTWRDFSALAYHHWTQPLPGWLGYWAYFLPGAVHRVSCAVALAIELVVPFLIFGPPLLRRIAFVLLAGLQVAIAASGSYGFFNLLTCVLCLSLVDDAWVGRLWRRAPPLPPVESEPGRTPLRWVRAALAIAVLLLSAAVFLERLRERPWIPRVLEQLTEAIAPLRSINSYGLFAVMTTERREIELEGSDDGVAWRRYRFPFKPDDPDQRPRYAAPHMPRLDWQMWFAALGDCRQSPWLLALQERLLQGSAPVLGLLSGNPFPDHPPRYLRTVVEDAHFQRPGQPGWWVMTPLGPFCPPLTLDEGGNLAIAQLPASG